VTSLLGSECEARAPRSIAAQIEERLLVPTYATRWAPATIAAHRGMAFPFQLVGQLHHRAISHSGKPIQIAGIGRRKLLDPFYATLFGELPVATGHGRKLLWSPDSLATIPADLVVAEVHRWMAAKFRRSGWLIVPEAVRWEGALTQVPPSQPSRSLRDDLKKVKNNGFTLGHGGTPEDWEEFYTEMVEPQSRSRHGARAWLPSRRLMEQFAAAGRLHFAIRDGVRVAGACSVSQDDKLWLPLTGIRHGDPLLLRQGAGNAALALTFAWARAEGYRRIDAGRTGAFINDGIQHSKRKWGLSPCPDPLAHLLAVLPKTEVARELFAAEPVLVEKGAQLGTYGGEIA
jgi:Acetyltransferase (GNAT) domain